MVDLRIPTAEWSLEKHQKPFFRRRHSTSTSSKVLINSHTSKPLFGSRRGPRLERNLADFLFVSVKIRFDVEGFVTHGALKGFRSGMSKFVTVQMCLLLETLLTNFALPGPVQVVNCHVTLDRVHGDESPATGFAGKRQRLFRHVLRLTPARLHLRHSPFRHHRRVRRCKRRLR